MEPKSPRKMRASYSVLAARVASLLIVVAAEGASSSILTESSGAEVVAAAAAAPILDPGGCGLYLAESSIPGGGMGMYLGERSLDLAERLGPLDVCHNFAGPSTPIGTIFENYIWDASSMGSDGLMLCPSFGSVANGHYALHNIRQVPGLQSDAGLHRAISPAAGSFTLYHGVEAEATAAAVAGEELFMNYGTNYFKNRDEYRDIFYEPDVFNLVDALIESSASLAGRHPELVGRDAEDRDAERSVIQFLKLIASRAGNKLIPDTFEGIRAVVEAGGAARNQLPKSIRSVDWLEENGSCIDILEPGPSEDRGRGRGAFASRSIREGDAVAVSPVLHLFGEQMEYPIVREDGTTRSATEAIVNYCFGHPDSPVLLWPYGPVVSLVNHDSANSNVVVRWADDERQPDWWADKEKRRDVIANDTQKFGGSGLLLEYVATRDIREGEEVLLDYGEAWEKAWEGHFEAWSPTADSANYTAAHFFNVEEQHPILRTAEEQLEDPYPANVYTKCIVIYNRPLELYDDVKDEDSEEVVVETKFLWEHPILEPEKRGINSFKYSRPCRIIGRKPSSLGAKKAFSYTVEVLNGENQGSQSEVRAYERVIAEGLPRSAIRFFEKPYFSDASTKDAFRMPIGMPGDMFPSEWTQSGLQTVPEVEV